MDHNNSGWNLGRSSSAGGGIVPASSADAAAATASGPSWRAAQNSQSTSEGSPSTRARGQSTWNRMKGAFKTSSREEQAKAEPVGAAAGNMERYYLSCTSIKSFVQYET